MRFHDNSFCLVRAGVCLIESRGRSSNSSWDLETRKWWGCCDNVSQAVSHVSCNEYIMRVSLPRPVPPSHGDEIQHCLRAADLISLETLTMLLLRNGSCERQHNSTELDVSFHFLLKFVFCVYSNFCKVWVVAELRPVYSRAVQYYRLIPARRKHLQTLPGCEQRNWMSARKTTRRSGHETDALWENQSSLLWLKQ